MSRDRDRARRSSTREDRDPDASDPRHRVAEKIATAHRHDRNVEKIVNEELGKDDKNLRQQLLDSYITEVRASLRGHSLVGRPDMRRHTRRDYGVKNEQKRNDWGGLTLNFEGRQISS